MERRRIRYIDEVRGFAIFLVILGHAIGSIPAEIGGSENNLIWKVIYTFHMPLMFMVSGMVSSDWAEVNFSKVKKQVLKNLVGIYLPYVIWGYVYWGISMVFYSGRYTGSLEDGKTLLWNTAGWPMGWFLLALVSIKMIDIVMQVLLHRVSVERRIYIEIAFWVALYFTFRATEIWLWAQVFQYGIFYIVGRYVRNHRMNRGVMLTAFFASAICANSYNWEGLAAVLFAIFACVLIKQCFENESGRSLMLEKAGQRSMVMYVLHPYFVEPVKVLFLHCGVESFAVILIFEMAFFFVGMFVVFKLIDRFRWIEAAFYPARFFVH
ncbi:MAG: acyltransferase [Lachnospiraceae bacterium]|nr:acyltransferase [Lachnospiraceae bacterium]